MLNELLAKYWDAAHAEGKEGRNHDTKQGDAQKALCAIHDEVNRMIKTEREACAASIPTNWCDPMLTGDSKALSDNAGQWGCPDVEKLLLAIKKRIESR